MTEDWQQGGFGLYVHWPFCQAKCPYCDFNSHVAAQIDQTRWRDAYLSEIKRISTLVPDRTLNTIFFGGGTPSLMQPEIVADVIDAARAAWPTANDMEITLEANPTSVEAGRFQGYRDAGVNRVSMGVQSLRDDDLRRLGRLHTVAEARAAFDIARNTFDRVSFDLIYARQDQTPEDWANELREALSMAVDHLSLYQLTIEAGTAFGDRYDRGLLRGLPDEDSAGDMYFLTQEICEAAGLPAYEVSNHARPGAESRHNTIYWRYGDYAGIGPGAHGRLTINGQRHATDTPLNPSDWLNRVELGWNSDENSVALSRIDQAGEYLMMGLRLRDGISISRYESLLGGLLANTSQLEDLGMVHRSGDVLRTTDSGRAILNAVIRELLPEG